MATRRSTPRKAAASAATDKAPTAIVEKAAQSNAKAVAPSVAVEAEPASGPIHEALLWSDDGWTAKVIKNEEDDGWAVAMTLDGESEPSLIGPWTMGRDKKNPKPLDSGAFATLVKTASEVIRRHEQQAHAALHKSTKVATADGRVRVTLDIVPDEDAPYAVLSAFDDIGGELARFQVAANFKFNHDTASAWVQSGFAKPGGGRGED